MTWLIRWLARWFGTGDDPPWTDEGSESPTE